MAEKELRTQSEVASSWLEITLEGLRNALAKKGVSTERQVLFESISGNLLKGSGGDVDTILVRFLFHGRFLDMGVGRGHSINKSSAGENFLLEQRSRRPKKWYSPTITHEIYRLADLMNELTGQQAINVLESGFGDIEINI